MVYFEVATTLGAGQSLSSLISGLSIQIPEPGMMMLFGIGAGLLGLRMGRRKSK